MRKRVVVQSKGKEGKLVDLLEEERKSPLNCII